VQNAHERLSLLEPPVSTKQCALNAYSYSSSLMFLIKQHFLLSQANG